jgi:hypothetical protein
MNFLISTIVFAVSVFLLVVSVRYGLKGAEKLDNYFSIKKDSGYPGFQWYYRIPFSIGVIPEYFFAIVLGYDNYFKRNWWALKTASFISVFVFIASLKSRSSVSSYFLFDFIQEKGFAGLFTSGNFVIFMNIIVVLYVALFVLICIESIRMHGIYAPVRILVYSALSLFIATLTVITLSLIMFITVVYVVIKVIWFLFFSSKKKKDEDDEEESAGSILGGGYREFKTDLYEWEEEDRGTVSENYRTKKPEPVKRRRPKITRRRKKPTRNDDEIPRVHPN